MVQDGSETISVAVGEISAFSCSDLLLCISDWWSGVSQFDCVLMDLNTPVVVDGEFAARLGYIKRTNNKTSNTHIITASAYSGDDVNEASNLFAVAEHPFFTCLLIFTTVLFTSVLFNLYIPF